MLTLILLTGARFLVAGAFQISASITLRRELDTPWLYGLAGLSSVVFGALTLVVPGLGALVLVRMLAIFALVFGAIVLGVALRLRTSRHKLEAAAAV